MTAMTVLTRRRFLIAGAAVPATIVPGLVHARTLLTMPRATEGPFYPDVFPTDLDNDLVRIAGHVRKAGGQVLSFGGRVLDSAGAPVKDATVEIWQADVNGRYIHTGSAWSSGKPRDPAFQGYGKCTVGADGSYSFRTIRPVAYTGRCPHIHVKVHDPQGGHLTSQLYVAGDPHNDRDWLFRQLSKPEQTASSMTLKPANSDAADWVAAFDMVMPWRG